MMETPARPLSEIGSPIVAPAAPIPRPTGRVHDAGPELVLAASSVRMALNQLRHALGRDEWQQATANLGGEIELGLLSTHQALEALAHRAANCGGQPL